MIHCAYAALPDEAYPASFDSGLYVDRREENLMQDLAYFDAVEKEAIDTRVANYEELLRIIPTSIFTCTTSKHCVFTLSPLAAFYRRRTTANRSNTFWR